MKRLTKTTKVALAIVAGVTTLSQAQERYIRFDPVSKDVYRLTYRSDGPCHIRVQLVDDSGVTFLSREIHKEKSIVQPYNLANLKDGEYKLKVIDDNGEFVTRFEKTSENFMEAAIMKLKDKRAKVIVNGEYMDPVYVNILDGNDVLLFGDYIERARPFSKVYDLSKLSPNELRIEVASGQKILAASKL